LREYLRATGLSYNIGQADLRFALRVTVTATNPTGSTTATSAALLIAPKAVLTARFNAVLRAGQEVTRPTGMHTGAAGTSPQRSPARRSAGR